MRAALSVVAVVVAMGLTAVAVAMSCHACGGGGAGVDAGIDGITDGGDDGGPGPLLDGGDAGRRDAGTTTAVVTELQMLSSVPCDEWEAIEDTRVRGLPADTTPRLLWLSRPREDPIYLAAGLLNEYLEGGASIGVDGNLYIVGPEDRRVMSLTREGRMRWMTDWLNESQVVGPVAMGPEGDAFVLVSDPLQVVRLSAVGEVERRTGLGGEPLSYYPVAGIALGPHGALYAGVTDGRLFAGCATGDMHLRWVMTFRNAQTRRTTVGSPARIIVEESGDLLVSGAFDTVFAVDTDGELRDRWNMDENGYTYIVGTGRGERLFSNGRSAFLRHDDGGVLRIGPAPVESVAYLLDPLNGVWVHETPPRATAPIYSRIVGGKEQWRREGRILTAFEPGAW